MHLRWAGLVFPLLVAWPSDGRAAEPASPAGPVWEIESLEAGEFDYNLDDGRVILLEIMKMGVMEVVYLLGRR